MYIAVVSAWSTWILKGYCKGTRILDRRNLSRQLADFGQFAPFVDRSFGWARMRGCFFWPLSIVFFVEWRCTNEFHVTSRVHPRVEIQLLIGFFVQLWSCGYATAVICFPCQDGKDWKDRSRWARFWNRQKRMGFGSILSRWWFQIFFYFHYYLGKIPILTNIFQTGWNHQLVIYD